MATYDQNGALWTEFLDGHSELSYSLSAYSALEADDILLETAEIMSHDEDFFLHAGPAQRLGLV